MKIRFSALDNPKAQSSMSVDKRLNIRYSEPFAIGSAIGAILAVFQSFD